ncbi:MAG: lysylphosphatidylglycerol synthase transmembrane domain-containing protein [candidate division Zixibacteria bacterium]
MKKRINVIIGIAVSIVFIYIAFRRVELAEIVYSLRHVNYLWIIPIMLAVILTMVIRAYRWKFLLRPIREYKARSLFPSVMIGFMANNVLPVRLGEIVRAYSLGAKTGESRSSIFATVVIERVFDSLTLMLIFWLVFLYIPVPRYVRQFGLISLVFNIAAIIGIILLKGKGDSLAEFIVPKLSFLPTRFKDKIENIIRKFVSGLDIFNEYRALGYIAAWSLILWFTLGITNYFAFMAFGMYPSPAASFILLLFVSAAVMLPSAPGFVGVFQVGVIGAFSLMNGMNIIGYQVSAEKIEALVLTIPAFAGAPVPAIGSFCDSLGLFGISKAQSLSFSIVLWLSQYLPVTLLGLYYLKHEHLSLKNLRR